MSKSKQLILQAVCQHNDVKNKAAKIYKWLKSGLNIEVQINRKDAADEKVFELASELEKEANRKATYQKTGYGLRLTFKPPLDVESKMIDSKSDK